MSQDEREESRGFKVQDRRRFSDSGDARDRDQEPARASDASAAAAAPVVSPVVASDAPHKAEAPTDLEISFSTFVLSLSTQALAHLGEIPNPIDNTIAADLGAARHMIDILAMLRDKTRGNLDAAEQAMLDNLLYDLRMRYVESQHQR